MSKRLSIIHVAPCHVDLQKESGGVANVVRQLCLLQARQGHDVQLLCTTTELGNKVALPRTLAIVADVKVTVIDQRANPLLGPGGPLRSALASALERAEAPDRVAHVHTCFSMYTEVSMREFASGAIPFVFSPHGKLSAGLFGNKRLAKMVWWHLFARPRVMAASTVGLLSDAELQDFKGFRLATPTSVIPNGFEMPSDRQEQATASVADKYVLFLGYLDPRKQPDFLLRAYARSNARRTHKLVFVGPDSYGFQSRLESLAGSLDITERVVFFGPAWGSTKWNLLRNAACICLPSLGEGLPVVLCEALGAGLPAIYSPQCNFPEIEANGAGVIVAEFDEASWAAAIDGVVDDCSRREVMSRLAKAMSSRFTWDAIAAEWTQLYQRISMR